MLYNFALLYKKIRADAGTSEKSRTQILKVILHGSCKGDQTGRCYETVMDTSMIKP